MKTMRIHRYYKALKLLLLIVLIGSASSLKAQFGGGPCTPVPLGVIPTGSPVFLGDEDNFGGNTITNIFGYCGQEDNTVFYGFRLPPDGNSVQVNFVPQFPGAPWELALLDSSGCSPAAGPASLVADVCGFGMLNLSTAGACLNPGDRILLKVSSPALGSYDLQIGTFPDGPVPVIQTSSGDTAMCAGEMLFLTLPDSAAYTDIQWFDGSTGGSTLIMEPGLYQVQTTLPGGCVQVASIVIDFRRDCVWPGDADNDRLVDAKDILAIGLVHGFPADPRTSGVPPSAFVGQAAGDVPYDLPGIYTGVNGKHANCNGDLLVDDLDVPLIELNYGQITLTDFFAPRFGPFSRGASTDPPIFFTFAQDTFSVGDTLRGTVHIGDLLDSVTNLYGFSFDLLIPGLYIDTNYIQVDYGDNWLNDDGNIVSTNINRISSGFTDIGFTRTDQTGRTGSGPVASFEVIVEDNIDGKVEKVRALPFGFGDVLAINPGGDSISLRIEDDTTFVSQVCNSRGLSTDSLYIDGFKVNSKRALTGDDGGYLFTQVTAAKLKTNTTYNFGFKPGFPGATHDVHWRLWMDVNIDGDFDDPGELLIDTVSDGIHLEDATIPDSAALGFSTLRIQAKWEDGIAPEACEDFANGEVEDYEVEIISGALRNSEGPKHIAVWPNPGDGLVQADLGFGEGDYIRRVEVTNADGKIMQAASVNRIPDRFTLDLRNLPPGQYILHCSGERGDYAGRIMISR